MNLHTKVAAGLVAVGALAAVAYTYVWPRLEAQLQIETSDARGTKGRIEIGVDNWVGYYPLCSSEMRKRMRVAGYVLHCEDDKADYASRFEALRAGKLQFAVTTVDAYLLNGAAAAFPGALVAIIDESKGGDAIVGWKDKLDSLDALKKAPGTRIAFTPASPSEHLLRAAAVHFDVPMLRDGRGAWRVETDGSPAALKQLLGRKVDAAALWEPDVTRALATPGVTKLLSTADTRRLIVDGLLASRTVMQQDPDMVRALLATYFDVLRHYQDNPELLARDLGEDTGLTVDQTRPMLGAVAWAGLADNFHQWFGATPETSGAVDVVSSTLQVLLDSQAIAGDPLPERDPYRILNREFVQAVFTSSATGQVAATGVAAVDQRFKELNDQQWAALREVGTLKALNVVFQSGTADLAYDGKVEVDRMMDVLRHYPTFRIRVRGHTALSGDPESNRQLSQERADSVARYMNVTYGVDPKRVQVVGLGASKPLPRLAGETDRAYQYRLPRVEVVLLSDAR